MSILRLKMTKNMGFRMRESFVGYSNPGLLQIASYLAQHDVAFNNLPKYPTENSEDQDVESIEEVEPVIKLKTHGEMSSPPPPRVHSPPVRDTSLNYPQRKPLHAPTERRLNAAKASQLRQLINKSKAALRNLDSEISIERADTDLRMLSNGSRMTKRCYPPRRAVTSSGVLKPSVRILSGKGARKDKRSALERWANEAVSACRKASHHSARPGAHDTNLLSSYLKRLALGRSFEGQFEDLQRSYLPQSCKSVRAESPKVNGVLDIRPRRDFQYQRKCPPELVAFLKKWGESLQIHDPSEAKGICISPSRGPFYDSFSDSLSASTDSIENFIRNHSKQQVSYQNQTLRATEVERNRHDSPKIYHSKYFSRAQSLPKVKIPLAEEHSITSSYQTLRLPVEQYRRLLSGNGTAEAVHEECCRQYDFPSNTVFLSRLCDWLAEEIVDSCVEAIANLIDCYSSDVIDELFRHELFISSSSSWESFSGLAGSPQLRQTSSLQRLLMPISSGAPIELNQQEVTYGKCFLNQESERRDPTPKHGSYFAAKPAGFSHTQPSGKGRVVAQEARVSALQPPNSQPQNVLSPVEEVSTVSFSSIKVRPDWSGTCKNGSERLLEGSSPASTVESTLESACISANPHNYVTENGWAQNSAGAASSPDHEGVIDENVTLHCSTGDSLQKNPQNFSTIEDVRAQTAESTICPPQLIHTETIVSTVSNAKTSVPAECGALSDTSTRSSSIQTSSNSRKRFKLSGGLRMSSSVHKNADQKNSLSSMEVLAQKTAGEEVFCNQHRKHSSLFPESESSSKEFSLGSRSKCDCVPTSDDRESNGPQSTQSDRSATLPITSEGLSSPKPVKLHQNPRSFDLVSSLTDTSVPDISTPDVAISTNSETLQAKTSPVSDTTVSVIEGYGNYEEDFESTNESN